MYYNNNAGRHYQPTPYPGISYAPLWRNNLGGGHTLLKLEAGASLPLHRHPGWEQIHVIKGRLQVNAQRLEPGDHLLLDAGESHSVKALEPSVYLALSEKAGAEMLVSNDADCGKEPR
ncbi:cupin domain-containing protein [Brenneria izadpanahii]|uniref:Cupin domain-containing protein n=1 Tax=Brenneria izadpanahii TaxID=2722756 RepID=A0ABX7UXQ6_9GAMM|nr:cupin domain-containing protein [Brenneria izadpanahii]QTF09127.1 cupin domain-containing protein [Brenneria izadpanahii]